MGRLIKPTTNFTIISNALFSNPHLSFKAKGLYGYLVSKPDNYQFSFDRILKESEDGRASLLSTLRELEAQGYLLRKKQADGRSDYILFNDPSENSEFQSISKQKPSVENPTTGNPTTEKASLRKSLVGKIDTINKTEFINNTDLENKTNNICTFEKFVEDLNEKKGSKYKTLNKKARRQFEERIREGRTQEDFFKVIQNCFKDKFHIENPHYSTPEYLTRDYIFEKYLNYLAKGSAPPTQTTRAPKMTNANDLY